MSQIASVPYAGARSHAAAFFAAASLTSCLFVSPGANAWQPGKDGNFTVGANTAYASLAPVRITTLASAAAAGATTLTLTSAAGISSGDVLMVYQAQGATIGSGDTATYGAVSSLGNAGRFELVSVLGVVGSTVTLSPACGVAPLRFSYANASQVIRVPQYGSLTISAGATLSAPQWGGATGGVMPLLVQNNLVINGALSASGAGFRGGVLENISTSSGTDVLLYRGASDADGAEKGEGIAGFQTQYDALNGRYGRGAPANGGGGGNSHNAGGGGGANGGFVASWNGQGNPSLATPGWAAAWNLDGTLTSTTTSSGGGRGGYSFANSDQNALTLAPGNAAWGGNSRRERGGLGGRPLANNPSTFADTRLFLGGGGGAGDSNNSAGSAGARGGGLVLVVAGAVSGSGQILSDGLTAANSSPAHNDAPGGGGAGGSILVSAVSASGVTLRAQGGNGGDQLILNSESEGPGGGGSGGYIAAPAILSTTVTGGANGTTSSSSVTEFTPNGATRGGAGNTATVPALASLPVCATAATIALGVTKSNAITTYTPGGTATYTIVVTNTGSIAAVGSLVNDTLPLGVTLTAPWTCTASAGGSCPASGGVAGGSVVTLSGNIAGASGTLTITVPVAYSANPAAY